MSGEQRTGCESAEGQGQGEHGRRRRRPLLDSARWQPKVRPSTASTCSASHTAAAVWPCTSPTPTLKSCSSTATRSLAPAREPTATRALPSSSLCLCPRSQPNPSFCLRVATAVSLSGIFARSRRLSHVSFFRCFSRHRRAERSEHELRPYSLQRCRREWPLLFRRPSGKQSNRCWHRAQSHRRHNTLLGPSFTCCSHSFPREHTLGRRHCSAVPPLGSRGNTIAAERVDRWPDFNLESARAGRGRSCSARCKLWQKHRTRRLGTLRSCLGIE